jgi:hypothetical protein
MKLTAGEIYFIGEKDLKGGLDSRYFKIGIVRDGAKGPRTSEERLLEHQTGNPRKLVLKNVVKTQVVEEIETRIHRIFAPLRVNGEWLELSEEQYSEALTLTMSLAQEAESNFPALESADKLKSTTSNGKVIEPTQDICDIWNELNVEKAIMNLCSNGLDLIKNTVSKFATLGQAEGIASIQERKGRLIFNIDLFREQQPEFFERYQINKTSWHQRFTISKPKEEIDIGNYSPGLVELLSNLENKCMQVNSAKDLSSVHSLHVQLLSKESLAQWNYSMREAKIKSALGENEGFEGICKWSRVQKVKRVFDEKTFSEENPEMFLNYQGTTETTQAIVIQPMIGYSST